MLSVVIPTHESERVLVPTLAALVPGATAGVVREVIVADAGSKDETAAVADVAGCRFLVSPGALGPRLKAAAALARGPWLLFLPAGSVPDVTWVEETSRFVRDAELAGIAAEHAAVFRRSPARGRSRSITAEAFTLLATAFGARPRPEQGLLISKRLYDELGGHGQDGVDPHSEFLGRIGRRRIALLASGARMDMRPNH